MGSEPGWIQTHTGRRFYPLEPQIEDVVLEDVAHALSLVCRFMGHCDRFYSVAEHCVRCSYAPEVIGSAPLARWALLHDAAEAYLADVALPLKQTPELEGYRLAEDLLLYAVAERFGLAWPAPTVVRVVDRRMLATEYPRLMGQVEGLDWRLEADPYVSPPGPPWQSPAFGWTPKEARHEFFLQAQRLRLA